MSKLHEYLKSQESLITSSVEGKTLIDFINRVNPKDINKNKEGEVSINKMPNKNSKNSDKLGDYVDYEEID